MNKKKNVNELDVTELRERIEILENTDLVRSLAKELKLFNTGKLKTIPIH